MVCTELGVPITWTLPHGLEVNQSYLEVNSERIRPFTYSRASLTLSTTNKEKYCKTKQTIALMPNLIHSLDAASLMLLREEFDKLHPDTNNFYTIHDCFAVTANKVSSLILLLKSVYTMLYTEEHYLRKFDDSVLNTIKNIQGDKVSIDRAERKITYFNKENEVYQELVVHDLDWVFSHKSLAPKKKTFIDSQYILN